uniref:Kelch domain containing 7A n=1 Tax=Cyprinodon variegatus TaxID=28743 RepID=A0A3Q2EA39_CYPVA
MPIEDLRDQFDMQLLLKLSFSAAAVLLVSWAYRFYRSKDVKETTPCGGENTEIQNTASHEYKRTRQKLCFQDKDDERKHDSATDDLKSDSTHGIHVKFPLQQVDKSKEVCSPSNIDQNKCMDKEMLQKDLPTISCSNIAFESALEIHDPTDDRMTAITGRRSPCFWTKHEGGVGVGRELRQDLEHQGVYSSFLSKAKIKVEDATVVLDGSGHKIVNGKIYDYYVESKSHSVKDSKPLLAHYERNTVTNRTYRKENISFSDSPSSGKVDVENSASFMQLPAEIFLGTDLEVLKSNLDLGNCLEILHQAKKTGHKSVHQAALEVMSDNYLQVLRDPTLYGQLTANERERIRRQRMRGRRFVIVADMVPQDWNMSSAMYYYDDYKDVWHSLCLIPQEVISKACAMCTMDNYLFVAVGCQGSDREMIPSKRVFCYNPLTSIWKEISPMNEARPRCKLAALEGYIYAIGGECLSSVERYDPRQDRWTFVAPLPNDTFAVAHHVTVCSGELFVSGGTLRYMLLRYNPQTNTWRPSLIVGNKDKSIDMVAVGKFLYRFEVNPLLGVSVYRYHTVARLWYECSSKRLLHCPAFQCIAMDGTVYCLSRHFTMKFEADEISPAFADEEMSVLSKAKGLLFPFVLSLPDMNPRQTSV